MIISEAMNDGLFLAQLCFILGCVYNLKREYQTAICFHEKHLSLAHKFQDFTGQCRAYLILSEIYEKTHQYEKTKKYRNLHKSLSREVKQKEIK